MITTDALKYLPQMGLDPSRVVGGMSVNPHAIALCHAELRLDRPLIVQFLDFVWGFFRLDFGISMWSGKPVAEEIAARLPIINLKTAKA